ncbi:acyltransferase domain-containing protein [Amycolatopsis sp. A133]|uniref:acyltransferase domain-containing protein n=1 Tax=Amycolatopsis sp. A133 TaxID=3064472 RepID=UPI0027E76350|nr:acyltransferase domain-containing protein [Amycolatopsis sp. A133]MDQ7806827.1 acyltransferase domain-containing protein [Amycolatopsis sp. A133]
MATPTLTTEHEHTGSGHDVVPLIVSADSKAGLRSKAHRLARYLADHPDTPFESFARSVAAEDTGRAHRVVLLAGGRTDGLRGLETLAAGQHPPEVVRGSARRAERVVFVFPGQGSQWPGMALDLLDWSPVFAAELARCDAALAPFAGWSIMDVLRGHTGAPTLDDGADVVQPVLFAVMVALAALWRAHGVEPAAVVGHSLGEVAAACATGALSHGDGMRVAALWSSAQATLSGRGDMISVPLPVAEVRARLAGRDGLDVGAVNAPTWVIVSGDSAAVAELLADLTAEGVRARRIPVGLAAHSRHIDDIRDRLLADLAPLSPVSTVIPFHSTVTEGPLDTATLDAGYWFRNLRNPVRFDEATRGLVEQGYGVFAEISPHPVLTVAVQDTVDALDGRAAVLGTIRRREDGPRSFLGSLAAAYVSGASVDWTAAFPGGAAEPLSLPGAGTDATVAAAGLLAAGHPLLGAALELAEDGGWLFTGRLSAAQHPWLAGHTVLGRTVLPSSVLVELVVHAATELGCARIEELTQHLPVVFAEEALCLQVRIGPVDDAGARRIGVFARPDSVGAAQGGPWTRHATGTMAETAGSAGGEPVPAEWPPPGARPEDVTTVRDRLRGYGIELGPAFGGLTAAWSRDGELFAEIALPPEAGSGAGYGLHPALLDPALQAVALFPAAAEADGWLASSWSGLTLHAAGATALRIRLRATGADSVAVTAADGVGRPVFSAENVVLGALPQEYVRAPHTGPATRTEPDGGFAAKVAALPAPARAELLLDLVLDHTAQALGLAGAAGIGGDDAFTGLGFESLTAVELRNRLAEATGLKLRTTLAFDYPTPAALAGHLLEALSPADSDVLADLDRLEAALSGEPGGPLHGRVKVRLRDLLFRLDGAVEVRGPEPGDAPLDAASDDEIFALLDRELDLS